MVTPTIDVNGNVVTKKQVADAKYVVDLLNLKKPVRDKINDELSRLMLQIMQIDLFKE